MANIIIDPIEIMISGKVRVDVRDQNNNTKHFQRFSNIISDDLKNAIASAMQGNSAPAFITNAGSDWLSLKAIYNLSERSSVQFNWANINDQRMELFLGDKSRLRDYERSGQYIDLQYTMNF